MVFGYQKTATPLRQESTVRGNAVFGRYYAVFQARTPFWKLCRVPWTQFYWGQYSRFEARFSRFQCCNPFCVHARFINPMLSSRHHVQPYDTLGAATTGYNAHRLWCDSGATKRVIHNIFICINHTCCTAELIIIVISFLLNQCKWSTSCEINIL